jgi:hypothetical protein
MGELRVGPHLVGVKVKNAARPEWGAGTVLRVQPVEVGVRKTFRVSVQFATGHRTLLVPPARLVTPEREPQRESGWLAGLGKNTLDDRLRALPQQVVEVLGTPRERLSAVIPLYALRPESESLLRWAREQTGVSDPLTCWTRDELLVAFQDFCAQRDAHLRHVAALLKRSEGGTALAEAIASIPEPLRSEVRAALQAPI